MNRRSLATLIVSAALLTLGFSGQTEEVSSSTMKRTQPTKTIFVKPYSQELFGAKTRPRFYPYPEKLWKNEDCFPLLVLDGGAFFFTHRHLGGCAGKDFMDGLSDGRLLSPWLKDGKVRWDLLLDQAVKKGGPVPIEQHVWLNRLYFLLPIAQRYFWTGDEKYARQWRDYFHDWVQTHPFTPAKARPKNDPYSADWWDMQPAWRLMIFIHSAALLEHSKSITQDQWKEIYQAIHDHALRVHQEVKLLLEKTPKDRALGNHFLHQATALLYAGVLFLEFSEADSWVRAGRTAVERYVALEIHPDGGNVEASPSYSHFIARLCLEDYLLLSRNQLPGVKGLEQSVQKQYQFLSQTVSPEGRTLQVSDSYALDANADIRTASALLPLRPVKKKTSVCFKDSKLALLQNEYFQVYVDGSGMDLWHHHQGKPNLLVYAKNKPLLVDSGGCDYDLPEREDWYKTAQAHNAVAVAERKEGKWKFDPIHLDGFKSDPRGGSVKMTLRAESGTENYVWSREVTLQDRSLTIEDKVEASVSVEAHQSLHFAPLDLRSVKETWLAASQAGYRVVMTDGKEGKWTQTKTSASGSDNRTYDAPTLVRESKGRELSSQVIFKLDSP